MAFVDKFSGTDNIFTNVSHAVGSLEVGTRVPASNMRTDKMLVYYLLWNAFLTNTKYGIIPQCRPKDLDYSRSDKFISSQIKHYQLKNRPYLYPDGRVDRARGAAQTSITKTTYTIVSLFYEFELMLYESGIPTDYTGEAVVNWIINDEEFAPVEMRADLRFSLDYL